MMQGHTSVREMSPWTIGDSPPRYKLLLKRQRPTLQKRSGNFHGRNIEQIVSSGSCICIPGSSWFLTGPFLYLQGRHPIVQGVVCDESAISSHSCSYTSTPLSRELFVMRVRSALTVAAIQVSHCPGSCL